MKTRNQIIRHDLTLFRKNLLVVRTSMGLGASELSDLANLKAKKRVYDLEEGRGTPSLEEIITICKILKVTMDDMLFKQAVVKMILKEIGLINLLIILTYTTSTYLKTGLINLV